MEISEEYQTKNYVQSTRNDSNICLVCGQKLKREAVICGIKHSFSIMCKCEQEKYEKEKKQQENLDKMQRIEKLKSLSLLGERYKNVTFENTKTGFNPSFDVAFNRAKKYCENTEIVLKNGCGIYLFGDKGTGKTHCATRF